MAIRPPALDLRVDDDPARFQRIPDQLDAKLFAHGARPAIASQHIAHPLGFPGAGLAIGELQRHPLGILGYARDLLPELYGDVIGKALCALSQGFLHFGLVD